MSDDKPLPIPVTFDVVATLKYGASVDGFTFTKEAATEHAIHLIIERTGIVRGQILSVEVHERPRDIPGMKR